MSKVKQKNISKPLIHDSRVPRELKMYIDFINETYDEFEGLKWSNKSWEEIGFYHKNKPKKIEVFFGIWYDLWEHTGLPLCIAIDYGGKAPVEWSSRMKVFIRSKNLNGIQIREFEDYLCIQFEYEFFDFDEGNDVLRLAVFFEEIYLHAEEISRP